MARDWLSYLGAMRLVASNRSWWRPILLVATGLLGLFPIISLADDQVWTKAINLIDNTAFNRSTTNLVLAIHGSAMSGLGSPTSINLGGSQSVSIPGAPGQTVTLNLRNFVLTAQSSFTLQGTATTSFIINVTKQFSLSGGSRIILSGGVRWDQVFFNVLGRGSAVSLRGRTQLYGTLTARKRTVRLDDYSIVYGVVTARKILVTDSSRIIPPSIVSP